MAQEELQFMSRKAATVVIKHAIPALGVSVRAKLRVTTRVIVEPVNPAFRVTHGQFLHI